MQTGVRIHTYIHTYIHVSLSLSLYLTLTLTLALTLSLSLSFSLSVCASKLRHAPEAINGRGRPGSPDMDRGSGSSHRTRHVIQRPHREWDPYKLVLRIRALFGEGGVQEY